ncbi:Aste57867_13623 [Aphanomyces stellatus]|uniref:Aste57867_13623 protein n=1 Tax=Aphanomyces stellatus TaxID=120398 RepID=A0A485KZH6_9STRA|nr:hypothetical protein As57867_013573 [Aphanomyces stellatus]VFT90460.1 Aste57867_13623 [Aphanomyces stellatus]
MNTTAAEAGTLPLSPSYLSTEPGGGLDFLGVSRKRKASESDGIDLDDFLPPPPLSTENSANGSSGGNGTLTARAEGGGLRIKIKRTIPRSGPSPATTAPVLSGNNFGAMNLNHAQTMPMMPMQFNPMMSHMGNGGFMGGNPMHMSMPFQNQMMPPPHMNFPTGLGMPPPPTALSLAPQHSLLGNEGHQDLGPPPSAPPQMRIGHSLMGGGIEIQPAQNVDTINFSWNRRHSSKDSSTGGGGNDDDGNDDDDDDETPTGRPRSGSLPNLSVGFLDGLSLQTETSFFKEV